MFVGLLFYISEQDERRIGNSEFSAPSGRKNLEVVIVIAFIFSSGAETPMGDGKVLSATGSKLVETGIKTFYFLVLIAGGLMVYNSVSKLFKK